MPATAVGLMLRALARRDNPAFEHYRDHMNREDGEQRRLFPLLYEVFRSAVVLRFPDQDALEHIRAFLAQPRILLWPDREFPAAKAEALIRSALGERGLVAAITTTDAVILRTQLLTHLVEDMRLSDDDLDLLIARAEDTVDADEHRQHP